jgi:subfamily B ATP-binding cassette protein MsbA
MINKEYNLFIKLVKPQWLTLLTGTLCTLLVLAVDLALPLLLGKGVIDRILIEKGDLKLLTLVVWVVVGLVLVKAFFCYGQMYLMFKGTQRIIHDLRSSVFKHLLKLPVSYFSQKGHGQVISKATNDMAVLQNALSTGIIDLLQQGLFLAGLVVLIFVVNWHLALLSVLVLPLAVTALNLYGKRIRTQSYALNERIAGLTSLMNESLLGIRIVKAFSMEKAQEIRFTAENEQGFQSNLKSLKASAVLTPMIDFISVLSMVIVIWVGGGNVISGVITVGELVAFLAYLAMAARPVTMITRSMVSLQQAKAAAKRVIQILSVEAENTCGQGQVLPKLSGGIQFDNVSVYYQNKKAGIKRIKLKIEPGETLAVIGPSGAGKSTLIALIPRFFDPDEGSVRIDGVDIRQMNLSHLRSGIGLVPQETVLFAMSIKDNITVGRQGYSLEDIEKAAEISGAYQFIKGLPKGFDTVLEEGGASLSGGQRQRIAIARAILGNPRILIMDEATAHLDEYSESLVQQALKELLIERTSIIIAHKPSHIKMADRVIVMKEGEIVWEGRSEAALKESVVGLYSGGLRKLSAAVV